MVSSTEEHTVPKSRNETPVRTGPPARTTKSAFEYFREYGREHPKSWPSGASALGSYSAGNSSRGKRATERTEEHDRDARESDVKLHGLRTDTEGHSAPV